MNKNLINPKFNRKSTQLFITAAFFLLAAFSTNLRAAHPMQNDLRTTIYGPDSPKSPSGKKTGVQNTKTKKTPVPPVTTPPRRTPPITTPPKRTPPVTTPSRRTPVLINPSTNTSANALVNVTFTTQQAGAEIWLNNKNIGLTDENAVFSKKIPPNTYRVMVKKGNQVVFPTRIIIVTTEQADFKLFSESAGRKTVEAEPVASVPETTEKSGDEPEDREASAKVKQILEDYADPAKTDSVGREDWEFVFKSAQLGHLQDFTAVQMEAQRWFASGQIELAKQNYNYAFAAFKKAVEFMPKSPLPFYGIGDTYLADNQPAEALKALQQAVALDPKMAMAYKKIGDAQRLLKNKKEALAAYRNAIQLGYTAPDTRYWLGVTLLESERPKEGLKQLQELAESDPTPEIYVAIGDAYDQLKQKVSAVEFYRKAIENNPDLAVAYAKLGIIYLDEREYQKAKETLEKAIELDPDGKTFNLLETKKKAREATSKIK